MGSVFVCHEGDVQQEAISQKEIVFRFRKDIQSEKGWGFDILCMRRPGVKGICANVPLWAALIRSVARAWVFSSRRDIVLKPVVEREVL